MRIFFALKSLAFAALLSVACPAQDPVTSMPIANAQSAAFGSAPVCTDTDAEGNLWARGDAWKAAFESAGASFIPFFGSDAPRNFPVKFRLAAARRGGHDIALDAGARPERDGLRVEYRRGAVVEFYDLRPEGVEQSFRIDANSGSGDLALEVALHTELAMEISQDGLLLENEHGQVRMTRSFAFDAAGNALPVQEFLENGRITYVIAAADLESAAFPVTIDPFISSITWTSFAPGLSHPVTRTDIAFDAGSGKCAAIFEHVFSQVDHDVRIELYSGSTMTFAAYIDQSAAHWTAASIAANRYYGQFMVVAEAGPAGSRSIRGRTVQSSSHTMSAQFDVSGGELGEQIRPRIGGSGLSIAGAEHYAIAWERIYSATDHDILFKRWSAVTGGTGLSTQVIDSSGGTLDVNPAISKSNNWYNGQMSWIVVWERNMASDHDILGSRVGDFAYENYPINTASADTRRPAVSSITDPLNGVSRHLVAFEGPNSDIGVALMSGSQVLQTTFDLRGMEGVANENRSLPAVDTDGCRFGLTYRGQTPGQPFSADVYATTLHVAAGSLGVTEAHVDLPGGLALAAEPAVTSFRSGGGSGVRYAIAWTSGDILGSTTRCDVVAYDGRTATGGYTVLPTAYQDLDLVATGTPALGQPIAFSLQNAVGTRVIVAGLPIGPVYVCNPLLLGVDVWNGAIIVPASSLAATLPGDGIYLGLTFAVQGADIGGANGCSNVRVSDTILVTIQ